MNLPFRLQRHSKRLALSFDYVHDRFWSLPTYQDFLRLFAKWFLGGLIAFALLLSAQIWVPMAWSSLQQLLPTPLPPLTADTAAREANTTLNAEAQAEWQILVQNLQVKGSALAKQATEFVQENPNLFDLQIALDLPAIHSFQQQNSRFSPLFLNSQKENRAFLARASQPFRETPLRSAASSRRFLSSFTATDAPFPSRLAAEMALLKHLENINEVPIRTFLSTKTNRAEALEEWLLRAENIEESARRTLANISARQQEAAQRDSRFQGLANSEEANFVNALNALAIQRTQGNFEDFVQAKEQAVFSRANAGMLAILQQKYMNQLAILQQNIAAIEVNRDALIANIRFTPTPGIDLGLVTPTP